MAKTRTWCEAAEYCEKVYGAYVDWDERFFECPECGEPIYECDWDEHDWSICPVCDFTFVEEE